MSKIVERIGEYIEFKGLKVSRVESSINVSNGTLSKPIANNKSIKTETLEKFLSFPEYSDINLQWLFTGEGSVIINERNYHIVAEEQLQYANLTHEELVYEFLKHKKESNEDIDQLVKSVGNIELELDEIKEKKDAN